MAADIVSANGHSVLIIDQKPSFGRKFLMAGKSGLNLTKDENLEDFLSSYPAASTNLINALTEFGPDQVIRFAKNLDQTVFTGSSGRVFPKAMKASPMLRNWLGRLEQQSVSFWAKAKWKNSVGTTHTVSRNGEDITVTAQAVVFAMGGGSWSRLGSDGQWSKHFGAMGISKEPFQPSNVGVRITWSDHMNAHLGKPLKNVHFLAGGERLAGEAVLTSKGLEGTAIYNATPALRKGARLIADLLPQKSISQIENELASFGPKTSVANRLRKIGLADIHRALLMEFSNPLPKDDALARRIKSLEIPFTELGELDEAISTCGGVAMGQLDENFMIENQPGMFCAGEMLDWDAPTGGYLITACLATGRKAGLGVNAYLS